MKTFYKTLSIAAMLFVSSFTQSQNISTFAGNGTVGFFGDGGQATAAELDNTGGVFEDNHGNVFIADQTNGSIRMVNSSGIITTVVGIGTNGFFGDGGPATAAELNNPQIIWMDTVAGNLYIANQSNNRVRMVNSSGIISTIAGTGTSGFSGDGGPATAAEMNYPLSAILDKNGNLYIADYGNNRVRMVNTSGIISTFAGNGIQGFSGDGGQATAAELNTPSCARPDGNGNIFISEIENNRIRKVNSSGIISTVAGNGTGGYNGDGIQATSAELDAPFDVFIDNAGDLFIGDFINSRVREVNTSGVISTVAGNGTSGYSGDGGLATAAELYYPLAVFVDASSAIYIADWDNSVARKVGGVPTGTINLPVTAEDISVYPNPVNKTITIAIASTNNIDAIKVFSLTGQLIDSYTYGKQKTASETLDVSHYSNGIYFVTVISNGIETTRKLIISR